MAIMMGAVMAIVMLPFMLGIYDKPRLNIAIFAGMAIVLAGSLWLVHGQTTISGVSYMGAMILHHSIAIMTSERAGSRIRASKSWPRKFATPSNAKSPRYAI